VLFIFVKLDSKAGDYVLEKDKLQQLLNRNFMSNIYRNIKKYRKESGYRLMEVAEILDMSYDYLRRIESSNDLNKTCSLKLLIKFSIIYSRPLDDFIKED